MSNQFLGGATSFALKWLKNTRPSAFPQHVVCAGKLRVSNSQWAAVALVWNQIPASSCASASPQMEAQISCFFSFSDQVFIIPPLNSSVLWEVLDAAGEPTGRLTSLRRWSGRLFWRRASVSGQPWRSCGRGAGARCGASGRVLRSRASPLSPSRHLRAPGLSAALRLPLGLRWCSLLASPCLPTLPHALHLLAHGRVQYYFLFKVSFVSWKKSS